MSGSHTAAVSFRRHLVAMGPTSVFTHEAEDASYEHMKWFDCTQAEVEEVLKVEIP